MAPGPRAKRRKHHHPEIRTTVEFHDRTKQLPHRRREVRLVEHDEGVVAKKPRVRRPARPPRPVAREQQPRAHQINRPHDDRGTRRVHPPLPGVREPAPQHPQTDRSRRGKGRARVECARELGQRLDPVDPLADGRRRLIHERAPVDDVHNPPGQLRVREPREQREKNARRLAETGRNLERHWHPARNQLYI